MNERVGKAITTPEIHKAVHFETDCVRIFPASPDIAERFSGIELAMARRHIDQWMLDEDSTPTDIRFVLITDEQLLRRQTLRASNYTLLGFDDREIDDEEILKRSITIDPALVSPAATIPPKPRAAQAAEHVTEKDLPLIQRFAAEQGMTVVGFDLHRWNPAKERFEKLIYVQTVTQEEAEIIQLISNRLLAGKS